LGEIDEIQEGVEVAKGKRRLFQTKQHIARLSFATTMFKQ
jgi:hypothetical protein